MGEVCDIKIYEIKSKEDLAILPGIPSSINLEELRTNHMKDIAELLPASYRFSYFGFDITNSQEKKMDMMKIVRFEKGRDEEMRVCITGCVCSEETQTQR